MMVIYIKIDFKSKAVKPEEKCLLCKNEEVNSGKGNNNSKYACTQYWTTQRYQSNINRPIRSDRCQYNNSRTH
jgi:hypothetical protein